MTFAETWLELPLIALMLEKPSNHLILIILGADVGLNFVISVVAHPSLYV